VDRLDQAPAELGSHLRDVHVHGSRGGALAPLALQHRQELLPAQRPAGLLGQRRHEGELGPREGDDLPRDDDPAALAVKLEPGRLGCRRLRECLPRCLARGAERGRRQRGGGQQLGHSVAERPRAERPGQPPPGKGRPVDQATRPDAEPVQKEHGRRALPGLDGAFPEEGPADGGHLEAWHGEVKHEQVRVPARQRAQRLGRAAHHLDIEARGTGTADTSR